MNENLKIFIINLNNNNLFCKSTKSLTTNNIYNFVKKRIDMEYTKLNIYDQFGCDINKYDNIDIIFNKLNQRDLFICAKFYVKIVYKVSPMNQLKNQIIDSNGPSVKLLISCVSGEKMAISLPIDDPVYNLHKIIENELEIPENEQKLIFSGKELEKNKLLSDYNVVDECIIHLVLKLRAGMFCHITAGEIDYIENADFQFDVDFDNYCDKSISPNN